MSVNASTDIRKFDWRLKYNVQPEDMENLQDWIFETINALAEGVGDRAILKGGRCLPLSGLTVRTEPLIAVNALGEVLVVGSNSDVALASPVGNPARSLLVVRPLKTDTTSTPDPLNPSTSFNLHTIQGAEIVAIDGTPAATPAYPAINSGDVVLMGFELSAGHATIVQGNFQPGQRDQSSNLRKRVNLASANLTLDEREDVVEMDASGGSRTVTLPPASEALGKVFTVIKTDSSSNAVVIDGDGSETINGLTTVSLIGQWQKLSVISNGAAWRQV